MVRLPRQAGRVGQEIPDPDRLGLGIGILHVEPRQMVGDRVVEPQLPGVAQLQDGDAGEQLRVRRDAEDRIGLHWRVALDVSVAVCLGPDDLLVVHYADDETRQIDVLHLRLDPGVHQLDLRGHLWMVGQVLASGRSTPETGDNGDERHQLFHHTSPNIEEPTIAPNA